MFFGVKFPHQPIGVFRWSLVDKLLIVQTWFTEISLKIVYIFLNKQYFQNGVIKNERNLQNLHMYGERNAFSDREW